METVALGEDSPPCPTPALNSFFHSQQASEEFLPSMNMGLCSGTSAEDARTYLVCQTAEIKIKPNHKPGGREKRGCRGSCGSSRQREGEFVQGRMERDFTSFPPQQQFLRTWGLPPCTSQPSSRTSAQPAVLLGLPAQHCQAAGGGPQGACW